MCTSSDFVPSFRELTEKDFQEHEFLYKYIVEHKLKSNYLPYLVGINAHFYFDSEPELNYQSGFTTYGINHNGSSYLMKLDHASLPFIGDFYGQCFSNDPTNDRFWDRMSKK